MSAQHTPGRAVFVTLRISKTISNEYANRCSDHIPEEVFLTGKRSLSLDSARAILADAEFNSDLQAQDVGEYGVPLGVFNAYRALAKQARAAIAKATGSTA